MLVYKFEIIATLKNGQRFSHEYENEMLATLVKKNLECDNRGLIVKVVRSYKQPKYLVE